MTISLKFPSAKQPRAGEMPYRRAWPMMRISVGRAPFFQKVRRFGAR